MLWLTPGPPSDDNSESHKAKMSSTMSIGIDGELYPHISGTESMNIF